jgi:Cu/Ag efflux pump CusA
VPQEIHSTPVSPALRVLPGGLSHAIGSDRQRPFAIVIIGGLVSSTLATMLLLPTLYKLAESWFGAGWRARHPISEDD